MPSSRKKTLRKEYVPQLLSQKRKIQDGKCLHPQE